MGTVLPFFIDAGFDPEATTVMGDAFERACKQLHDRGQPEIVRELSQDVSSRQPRLVSAIRSCFAMSRSAPSD
jgi:hypothetical protein